jgi:hypothetical protein
MTVKSSSYILPKFSRVPLTIVLITELVLGGFQLEFVSISQIINNMTYYNFECSHWWKKNPLQNLLSSLNAVISTNESTRIITGHVIYNPAYTYKFQLKTTLMVNGTLLKFDKRYKDNLGVIFDQWPKLHEGLNELSNQKILKGI